MIYAVKLTMKDSDTGTSTTEKKLLISASNDSNAFDIICNLFRIFCLLFT